MILHLLLTGFNIDINKSIIYPKIYPPLIFVFIYFTYVPTISLIRIVLVRQIGQRERHIILLHFVHSYNFPLSSVKII